MEATEKKIIEKVIEENKEGFQRLAEEKPAAERRSKLKRIERKIKDLFRKEEEVGYITV